LPIKALNLPQDHAQTFASWGVEVHNMRPIFFRDRTMHYANAVLLAITDDVPDDQEVPGKAELSDQSKLVFDLGTGLLEQMAFRSTGISNSQD
jgi:hypothetical protein